MRINRQWKRIELPIIFQNIKVEVEVEVEAFYCYDYCIYPKLYLLEDNNPIKIISKKMLDFKISKESIKLNAYNDLFKKNDAIQFFKDSLLGIKFDDNIYKIVAAPSKFQDSTDFDDRFMQLLSDCRKTIFLRAKKSVKSSHCSSQNKLEVEIFDNIIKEKIHDYESVKEVYFIDDIFTHGNTLKASIRYLKDIFPNLTNVKAIFLCKTILDY
jgi:hypothetical protein